MASFGYFLQFFLNFGGKYVENYNRYEKSNLIFKKIIHFPIRKVQSIWRHCGTPSGVKMALNILGILVKNPYFLHIFRASYHFFQKMAVTISLKLLECFEDIRS